MGHFSPLSDSVQTFAAVINVPGSSLPGPVRVHAAPPSIFLFASAWLWCEQTLQQWRTGRRTGLLLLTLQCCQFCFLFLELWPDIWSKRKCQWGLRRLTSVNWHNSTGDYQDSMLNWHLNTFGSGASSCKQTPPASWHHLERTDA